MDLIHGRCAYPDCEKICGCRVSEIRQYCDKCNDKYCTLPRKEEWWLCLKCKKRNAEDAIQKKI